MKIYIKRLVRFVRRILGIEVWHHGKWYGTTKEMAESIDKAWPFVTFITSDPELSKRFIDWQDNQKAKEIERTCNEQQI